MKIPNIPNIFSISNLPYISLTSLNIFVTGFPFQRARHEFQNIPIWAEDQCETFNFQQFVFYPHSKIYVQLTVNHVNYSDASFVHEAVAAWVESVNTTQFTACVTRAGRTILQTVLLRLIGLHIKVLPQEEFLVKNCFLLGELGLFVKQLLFPA